MSTNRRELIGALASAATLKAATCGDPRMKVVEMDGQTYRIWDFQCAGDLIEPHAHKRNHVTMVVRGAVEITLDGVAETVRGFGMKFIPAPSLHGITALEPDSRVICIFDCPEADAR